MEAGARSAYAHPYCPSKYRSLQRRPACKGLLLVTSGNRGLAPVLDLRHDPWRTAIDSSSNNWSLLCQYNNRQERSEDTTYEPVHGAAVALAADRNRSVAPVDRTPVPCLV